MEITLANGGAPFAHGLAGQCGHYRSWTLPARPSSQGASSRSKRACSAHSGSEPADGDLRAITVPSRSLKPAFRAERGLPPDRALWGPSQIIPGACSSGPADRSAGRRVERNGATPRGAYKAGRRYPGRPSAAHVPSNNISFWLLWNHGTYSPPKTHPMKWVPATPFFRNGRATSIYSSTGQRLDRHTRLSSHIL